MATQVISFRASGDNLDWLESQRLDGESLSQTAQRICWEYREMSRETSPDPTKEAPSTLESTYVDIEKTVQTRIDFAVNQLREELLGELHA